MNSNPSAGGDGATVGTPELGDDIATMLGLNPTVDESVSQDPTTGDNSGDAVNSASSASSSATSSPTPSDDITELKIQLARQQGELEALKAVQGGEEPNSNIPPPVFEYAEVDEDRFNEITSSPESFNDFMRTLTTSVVERTMRAAVETMEGNIADMASRQQAGQQFYVTHPDLADHKPLVGLIGQQVQTEMPNASVDEILVEVAKRSKEMIKVYVGDNNGGSDGMPPAQPPPPTGAPRGSGSSSSPEGGESQANQVTRTLGL